MEDVSFSFWFFGWFLGSIALNFQGSAGFVILYSYSGTIIKHYKDPVIKQPGFNGKYRRSFFFVNVGKYTVNGWYGNNIPALLATKIFRKPAGTGTFWAQWFSFLSQAKIVMNMLVPGGYILSNQTLAFDPTRRRRTTSTVWRSETSNRFAKDHNGFVQVQRHLDDRGIYVAVRISNGIHVFIQEDLIGLVMMMICHITKKLHFHWSNIKGHPFWESSEAIGLFHPVLQKTRKKKKPPAQYQYDINLVYPPRSNSHKWRFSRIPH